MFDQVAGGADLLLGEAARAVVLLRALRLLACRASLGHPELVTARLACPPLDTGVAWLRQRRGKLQPWCVLGRQARHQPASGIGAVAVQGVARAPGAVQDVGFRPGAAVPT